MQKESLDFGTGSFVHLLNDEEFQQLPVREQALLVGWADSCPVALELTDPANETPGRGPETMLDRYGEVNFWFGQIARDVREGNPALYEQLIAPVARQQGEPAGKYEDESVPFTHYGEMSPMGTLPGYALPRIFIEQIGAPRGHDFDEQAVARLERGLKVLDEVIPQSHTPAELLARVAEGLAGTGDVTPVQILRHVLSSGWLKEHNARTMLGEVKQELEDLAPTIWMFYSQMTEHERNALKLA